MDYGAMVEQLRVRHEAVVAQIDALERLEASCQDQITRELRTFRRTSAGHHTTIQPASRPQGTFRPCRMHAA
jgi:hypothetical protein